MNREIKFRGKVFNKINSIPPQYVDCGWVYGTYFSEYNGNFMEFISVIDGDKCETNVYPISGQTLGQYTGLKDKNGKELYSNDLFKSYQTGDFIFRCWEVKGGFAINYGFDKWKDDIKSDEPLPLLPLADQQTISWFESTCEIIGNIYDNKELIKQL